MNFAPSSSPMRNAGHTTPLLRIALSEASLTRRFSSYLAFAVRHTCPKDPEYSLPVQHTSRHLARHLEHVSLRLGMLPPAVQRSCCVSVRCSHISISNHLRLTPDPYSHTPFLVEKTYLIKFYLCPSGHFDSHEAR